MNDDLPKTNTPPPQPTPSVGSTAKEVAPPSGHLEAPLIMEVGKEVELPPEVTKAGVTISSDTIVLPPPVAQLGVTATGVHAPPTATTVTVALPLTDDQIAKGLQQSIMTSWRWLSEWCKRILKIH